MTDWWLCLPLILPPSFTTSRQETGRFFSGKTKQSQRKELPNEKVNVPPGHLTVTATIDKPSHTGSCPSAFSVSFSMWPLSQRSPDMWGKPPDRRERPKKVDKRNWKEKETMQGTKQKCNNFPPIDEKTLIPISAQMSLHQRDFRWPLCPKQYLPLLSTSSFCLISGRKNRNK